MQLILDLKQILSSQTMSQQSSDQRHKIQLLWNVADPDDPYDIRKSMISSLPHHTQNFMGGNLQIVCLMQAAEIQRLNTYLSQFRSKYRQLQRIQLDRHLYEVQIKQLAQKAKENERFKIESEKLKQYIKRLTFQMQELNKKPNIPLSLQTEHQQLRRRYQSLLTQLKNVRQTIGNNNITINKLTEENLQLRMKYDRLDKQRLTQLTQQREKYEAKIRERIEIEIRQVQSRLNSRIGQLESDCRLYKEQLESKNHEISSLIAKNQSLRQELDRHKSVGHVQSANKISQLQAINEQLSRKASELQYIFQQYTRIQMKLKQAETADRRSEQQNRFLKQQISRLKSANQRQIQIYVQKIQQQENKIALLSSEIERLSFLSSTNKSEVDRKYGEMRDDYEIKIKHIIEEYQLKLIRARDNRVEMETLEADIRSFRSVNQQIRSKNQSLLNQITFISRRLSEIQGQNQRIKSSMAAREDQLRNYQRTNQSLSLENMSLRKSLMQKDRVSNNIETERANYETKIKQLIRQVQKKQQLLKELQNQVYRNHKLAENYENARSMLAQNQQYIQRLKKELTDAKRRSQQYEIDLKNGTIIPIAILEQELRRNTEQITIKIRLQQELQIRKYIEQKTILQKQISKLIQQNRHLEQQFIEIQEKLSRREQEGRQSIAIIENRYVSQIADLTNSIKVLKEQNQRLASDRNKLRTALTDTERVIGMKQREYGEGLRQSNRRADELRAGNQNLKLQITRIRQQLSVSQEGNQRLQRQIQEKLIKIYNSQLQEKDNIISTLERQVKAAREEIKSLQATYQNSNTTIKNYKERLLNLSQQIERLNDLLKKRGEQLQDYKREWGNSKSKDEEINRLKIQIREVQQRYVRIVQSKQQQVRNIRIKIEGTQNAETTFRRQIKQRDDEIKVLRKNLQDIEDNYKRQIRQKQDQLNRFKSKISKFDETIEISMKQKDEQISKLNFTINNLNQAYRKQLGAKEDEINKLNIEANNIQQTIRSRLREKEEQINRMNANMKSINENHQKKLRQRDDEINRYKIQINDSGKQVRNRLRERQEEVNRLKGEIGNTNNQFQILRKQLRDKDDELRTLKNRITENQQNYRRLLSQRQQQIREISEKLLRLNQDKDRGERDIKMDFQKKMAAIVQNQTNSLRNEMANLAKQKQLLGNQLIGVRKQLESKIMLMRSMQSEMTQLRRQRQNHLKVISQLESSFEQINIKIRTSSEGLDKKCHQQQIQIINFKKYIEQLEGTINHTIEERDHLFNVSHQYKDELVKLKQQLANSSKSESAYYEMQKKYNQLTTICRQYQDKINMLSVTISESDAKTRQYQRSINQAINQIGRLSTLLKDRDGQAGLIGELRQQINILTVKLTDITESARQWEQKYIQLYTTYSNEAEMHRNKMLDHQRKVAILQQQFEQLNSLIITLKEENTYLRVQVTESSDLIEKNKHLSAEIDRLNYLKEITEKQLKDTRLVLIDQMALQKRLQQNLSLFVVLFAEIQTLRKRVVDTETQCENVRRTSLTPHRVDRQVGRSLQSRTQTVTRVVRRQ